MYKKFLRTFLLTCCGISCSYPASDEMKPDANAQARVGNNAPQQSVRAPNAGDQKVASVRQGIKAIQNVNLVNDEGLFDLHNAQCLQGAGAQFKPKK